MISQFDLKNEYALLRDEIQNELEKVFFNTSFIGGSNVDLIEKNIKDYLGVKYAISCNSGTDALHFALRSLGIGKGDEVITTPFTFISTIEAIMYVGAKPVFADIDLDTYNINCEEILKKITKKTRAILPVHIFGNPVDVERIKNVINNDSIKVIEDCAQSFGAGINCKRTGGIGDVGCLSFNGNKIITTGGGGAVITNKKNLAKKIRYLSSTAKVKHKWEYIHDDIGYNFKMPSLNAALGLAQISKIDIFLKAKRRLFNKYSKNLKQLIGVSIFQEGKNLKSNYWLQTLILDKRYKYLKDELLNYCYKKKIFLRPTWKLISSLKPYKKTQKMDLSGAKDIADRVINLPSSQSLLIHKS